MLNKAIMQDVPIKFWKSLLELFPSFLGLFDLILHLIRHKKISHLFLKSLLFMVWEEKFDLLRGLRIVNPLFCCLLLGSLGLSLWFWRCSNSWKGILLLIYSYPLFIAHIKERLRIRWTCLRDNSRWFYRIERSLLKIDWGPIRFVIFWDRNHALKTFYWWLVKAIGSLYGFSLNFSRLSPRRSSITW